MVVGKGGMVAYTGVNDLRVLTEKANEGDAKIQELLDAYYFQIAKEIACKSIALHGQVDQIILTGGVAPRQGGRHRRRTGLLRHVRPLQPGGPHHRPRQLDRPRHRLSR